MLLTIDKTNETSTTFKECFDYLMEILPTYHLLSQSERETCKEALEKLNGVFRRFYERK